MKTHHLNGFILQAISVLLSPFFIKMDGAKPGLWTLDWTMDWTMDWIMDWIMDSILDRTAN